MLDCQIKDPTNTSKTLQQQELERGEGNNNNNKKEMKSSGGWVGLSERMEIERLRRAENGIPDSWFNRKFMIFVVLGIYAYTYYVFVVRVSIPMIRMDSNSLGDQTQGIVYIVIYHILFVMFLWSYGMVIFTPPGFARDYIEKTDPPVEDVELVEYAGQTLEHSPEHPSTEIENLPMSNSRPSSPIDHSIEPSGSKQEISKEDVTDVEYPVVGAFGPAIVNLIDEVTSKDQSGTKELSIASSSLEDLTSALSSSPPSPTLLPLSYPPQVHHKPPSTSSSFSPLPPPRSPSTRSYLHFPPPPPGEGEEEEIEPTRFRPVIEREPIRFPVLTDDYRYNSKEGILAPYRSHRCRHCQAIVLRMDHHCPWVGGCVGARNYKYFLNFAQWSTTFTLFIFISLILVLSPLRSRPPIDGQIVAIVCIAGFFTLFTFALYAAHIRLTLLNVTTIEDLSMSRMRARERAALSKVYGFTDRRGRKETKKAWDLEWGRIGREGNLWWLGSRRKNWESIMGENLLGWFLPIPARPTNDGLSFVPNPRHSKEGYWRKRKDWDRGLR